MKTEQFSLRRMLVGLSLMACGRAFLQSAGSLQKSIAVPGTVAMLAGALMGVLKRPYLGAAFGLGVLAWVSSFAKALH